MICELGCCSFKDLTIDDTSTSEFGDTEMMCRGFSKLAIWD